MTLSPGTLRARQRGIVLVASLLLLLVVTIMTLSIFRSFGMQERIAGNTREKQRALHAAVGAQKYAEWWLATQSNAPQAVAAGHGFTASAPCNAPLIDANNNPALVQICSNTMSNLGMTPVAPPWAAGFIYALPRMNAPGFPGDPNTLDVYYQRPEFYITDQGTVLGGNGELFKVDAYSYGLTKSAVAVVESTIAVVCTVCNKGGL